MGHEIRFGDVCAAAERIRPFVKPTPVMTCRTLDDLAGASLYFKCENLQKVGAFKFRGACNAVLQLDEEKADRGVVTHSSGNHAQALALAARLRGIPAHIVMPQNAPLVKKQAVLGYGAQIVECEPTLDARESTANELVRQLGATFIHPYDHPDVIAGQGTAALELLQSVERIDTVIAPVGGGGLISGTCIAVDGVQQEKNGVALNILAAEPQGADDAAKSKAMGKLIPQTNPRTIADGLLTSLGQRTWPYVRDRVNQVITVSDDEIIEAMELFWTRTKSIIEPSSATAVAVALKVNWPSDAHVGIILSGGNVDLKRLPF